MRKRINDIARGRFEYAKPILSFSEDQIEFSVIEGREYSGSFEFHSTNNVLLRGVVYSTNPRMECLTPQFEGDEIKIRFQFKSKGLVEGDRVEGSFLIVCNDGEYSLSFCANISRLYPEASTGIIKNLYDFQPQISSIWLFLLYFQRGMCYTRLINLPEFVTERKNRYAIRFEGSLSALCNAGKSGRFFCGADGISP